VGCQVTLEIKVEGLGPCGLPVTPPKPVKQTFRTWTKILLHCGFGQTQVYQMTYEPMYSAQAQSRKV